MTKEQLNEIKIKEIERHHQTMYVLENVPFELIDNISPSPPFLFINTRRYEVVLKVLQSLKWRAWKKAPSCVSPTILWYAGDNPQVIVTLEGDSPPFCEWIEEKTVIPPREEQVLKQWKLVCE
jgi:hypothetical protein